MSILTLAVLGYFAIGGTLAIWAMIRLSVLDRKIKKGGVVSEKEMAVLDRIEHHDDMGVNTHILLTLLLILIGLPCLLIILVRGVRKLVRGFLDERK